MCGERSIWCSIVTLLTSPGGYGASSRCERAGSESSSSLVYAPELKFRRARLGASKGTVAAGAAPSGGDLGGR